MTTAIVAFAATSFSGACTRPKFELEALKEHYGVSISTLRAILSRLSSEGFVVAEARRGFEVASVSATDLRELAELRILLESHAIERSFERGDTEWEGRVGRHTTNCPVVEQRMGSSKRENALWKRYDEEFHQALISNCGSRLSWRRIGELSIVTSDTR